VPSVYAPGPVFGISRTLPAGIVVVLPNHRLAPSQGGHPHPGVLRRDRGLATSVPRDRLKRGPLDQVRPRPSLTYIKQPQSNAPKVILGWGSYEPGGDDRQNSVN
jgi:hypothetical protein